MDIKELLELGSEIDQEAMGAMTQQERTYHEFAKKLLVLERDLRSPGTAKPEEVRIERLLDAIENGSF